MPNLVIGRVIIPYTVRRSQKARRKRIVVTAQAVEVMVPEDTPEDGPTSAAAFIDGRRAWVFNAVADCQGHAASGTSARYASGSKVPYRGRNLMLTVEAVAVDRVIITCRSRFLIQHPKALQGSTRDRAIAEAMDCWLRERCLDDATRIARRHARRLDIEPAKVRLSDSRQYWGTCGKDRIIRVHANLIQAPASVLEYVVAHEVAHLIERNHSHKFWKVLASTMPDWETRQRLLKQWERSHERRRHI